MSDGPVKFALVGLGRAGHFHLNSLRITSRKEAVLATVVDNKDDIAQNIADEHGCAWSKDLDDAVLASCDAVIVASTTDTHFAFIKKALAAGKAVFTEKPISHHPEEVEEVLTLAKNSTKPFLVGYQRRFDRNYAALKNQCEEKLGQIRMVKCCSRDNPLPPIPYLRTSGGIFHDMLSHDFDMIHFLTGQIPVSCFSTGHAYLDIIKEMDDVDTVCVTLRFASGLLAQVDSSRISPSGYDQRVEVFGENGIAECRNEPENTVCVGGVNGFTTAVHEKSFPERYRVTYQVELAAFIGMCKNGVKEDAALIDRHALLEKVATAAEYSCRLRREVRLDEVDEIRKTASATKYQY